MISRTLTRDRYERVRRKHTIGRRSWSGPCRRAWSSAVALRTALRAPSISADRFSLTGPSSSKDGGGSLLAAR